MKTTPGLWNVWEKKLIYTLKSGPLHRENVNNNVYKDGINVITIKNNNMGIIMYGRIIGNGRK